MFTFKKHFVKPCVLGMAVVSSFAFAQEQSAASSEHTVTANAGLYSQYIFRGISQTDKNPALQGGVDYAHSSGIYLGVWGSNISWISDATPAASSSLELDFYGGYKKAVGDFSYDVGFLRYQYPGRYPANFVKPNTNEIYAQVGWKFITVKYSHSLGDTFGVADSKNSYYLDLSAAIPVTDKVTLTGHVGRQKYKGANAGVSNNIYSYTDYKLEGTYALTKEWTAGAGYTKTNAERTAYTNPRGTFLGDGLGYAFVKKTF